MRFFEKEYERMDLCTLRFLHCPPCDYSPGLTEGKPGTAVRIGEHTDFGMLTFLFHDSLASGEGLQLKKTEGGEVSERNIVPALPILHSLLW